MLRLASLFILFMLFLGGCMTSPQLQETKPLRVGMSPDYPPIAFKIDDKAAGIEAEFAAMLAKELGRDVVFKYLPWEQLPLALKSGAIDIVMSGVSITKERSAYAIFSDPYMQISQMALMKEGLSAPSLETQGRGSRIGFVFNTTGESFVKKEFSQASFSGYTNARLGVAALLNGDIDYFFHDAPSIWHYTAELHIEGLMGWYVPYTSENLAWAFNPADSELRDSVNEILDQWQKDGRASQVINHWIRIQVLTPNAQQPISFE